MPVPAPALSVVATPSTRLIYDIDVWGEVNELPGRELMRDGRWLV